MELVLERLPVNQKKEAFHLLEDVFAYEQNIPVELHDIKEEFRPVWWCARIDSEIVGIVAGWIEENEWHWGRFAVNKSLRGMGIGKKLAVFSLSEIFNLGADKIVIDARDITVGILKKLGGKVVGEPVIFYEGSVTPMILEKDAFLNSIQNIG